MKYYKTCPISVNQLFFLLFVSRILVSLTYIPSMNYQQTKGDLLLSILLAAPILILAWLPISIYMKRYSNMPIMQLDSVVGEKTVKALCSLYFLWFVLSAGLNVSRFVTFVNTQMSPQMSKILLSVLIIIGACYGAFLGLQSLGRVASVLIWLLLVGFVIILGMSSKYFTVTNFSPILENPISDNILNAVSIASSTSEMAVVLFVLPTMNEKIGKKFALWSVGVFAVIWVLYFFTVGTLGEYAKIEAYPVFTLSQISGDNLFERMEVVHTSFWLLALFLKTAMFISCASFCVKTVFPNISKLFSIAVSGVSSIVSAIVISSVFAVYNGAVNPYVTIVSFAVFIVVIPTALILLGRRKSHA